MAEITVEQILWSDSAKLSFNKIIEYLKQNWTDKEIAIFINRTQDVLSTLKRYPEMFRPSAKRKNVRIALLINIRKWYITISPGKKKL